MHDTRTNTPVLMSDTSTVRWSFPGPSEVLTVSTSLNGREPAATVHPSSQSLAKHLSATSVYVPASTASSRVSMTPRSPMVMLALKPGRSYMTISASPLAVQLAWHGDPIAPMSVRCTSAAARWASHTHALPIWSSSPRQMSSCTSQLVASRASQISQLSEDPSKATHSGSPKHEQVWQHSMSEDWSTSSVMMSLPLVWSRSRSQNELPWTTLSQYGWGMAIERQRSPLSSEMRSLSAGHMVSHVPTVAPAGGAVQIVCWGDSCWHTRDSGEVSRSYTKHAGAAG
mmetsp:Transcript_169/g.448  ORF Transcript_169/g.448 Transcript_169/m.448 type:complete len:285 (-) Transcript_169:114-968(-)